MADKTDKYLPALGLDVLTPLYDPLLKWVMQESRFKRHLLNQSKIEKGYRVLDLGCGTGTLTILIKQTYPDTEVVGVDGDTKVLEIARAKAAKAGMEITFDLGMAFQLPYPDSSFDRVLSSLVFHHLTTENKQRTLREICQVLRPAGELHVADFGKPHNAFAKLISLVVFRFEEADANIKGLLPEMFSRAGFVEVKETAQYMTVVGTLSLYKGCKSE